jgi:hypothetical protein
VPVPANPLKREFFVYQFKVDGNPFYVGIGRDKRASDRERYVRSLLTSLNSAKRAGSSLSVRVIAAMIKRKKKLVLSCTRKPLTRAQALKLEQQVIARLLRAGFQLTNWQHNPCRHQNERQAVRAILSKWMQPIEFKNKISRGEK